MKYSPVEPVARTKNSENWLENGIIVSRNTGNSVIELSEAQELTCAFEKFCAGHGPRPLMVDLATPKGQSRETREYFSNNPRHLATYSAAALLISNPISRVLANFYLGLNRPQRPTRLFTDYHQAMQWLKVFAETQPSSERVSADQANIKKDLDAA